MPCYRCLIFTNPAVSFHEQCYNTLEDSYKTSEKPTFDDLRKFADAVKPLYKPQDKEQRDAASVREGLFSRYTQHVMENSFRQELLGQLPAEVQAIILDFISPCWYLIVLGETRRLIEQLRNVAETRCGRFSLAQEIYITRTKYQGISYISGISNTPLESRLLGISDRLRLKLPAHVRKIVLSVDHIGVRRVQFMDQNSDPSPDGSPWYEIIDVPSSHVEAHVSCDVGLYISPCIVYIS
jgi:hypothetical protein